MADTVARVVEQRIAADHLPPGHRIGTKTELCAEHRIAPGTLAEALRVLRGRGIIDVRPGPGGGVFVAAQSPLLRLAQTVTQLREDGASANDVIAVLDGLDDAVIRDAAINRSAGDMRDLDRLGKRLEQAWSDPVERPRAMWALHRRIADISPNPILRAFYVNLVAYLEDDLARPDAIAGMEVESPRRLQVHLDLIEAIRSGDQRLVGSAIRRHRTP